ncbi:peroxidase 60-like [Papaver somniferum]|uniref:peroxidase 60-like n=1 Tax=Papaver somniferum TaxID=3469 RepID=UPI000E70487D|nr:peroxidase 60-like [Papaver somniferum]
MRRYSKTLSFKLISISTRIQFSSVQFKVKMNKNVLAVVVGIVLLLNFEACYGQLQVGFYNGRCGNQDVESIVNSVVTERFTSDPSIVAALLRMQFHDCFVNGCDASLLLDGVSSEKTAGANLNVRGFDLIDDSKTAIEQTCPGIVSCSDIVIMATRDAVALSGGLGARYEVETGRRDGFVSQATDVNLPGPAISVSGAIDLFDRKGLTGADMLVLLGGHTVGTAHCNFFHDRLWNFQNTGFADPSMDPALVATLQFLCPQFTNDPSVVVDLDQNPSSSNIVDNSFYQQISFSRGILEIDQKLALDPSTTDAVTILANDGDRFLNLFGTSMVRLGAVGILTGTAGEIRFRCNSVN